MLFQCPHTEADSCWKWTWTVKPGTNVPTGCIYHITFSLSVQSTDTWHRFSNISTWADSTELMPWLPLHYTLITTDSISSEAQTVKAVLTASICPNSCFDFIWRVWLVGQNQIPTILDTLNHLGIKMLIPILTEAATPRIRVYFFHYLGWWYQR